MKTAFALTFLLLLTACGKSQFEQSYDERLAEAKAHCLSKGGDEFKPYGSIAWLSVATLNKPMVFRCQKLLTHWKRGLAVYAFRVEGGLVKMEVR